MRPDLTAARRDQPAARKPEYVLVDTQSALTSDSGQMLLRTVHTMLRPAESTSRHV